MATTNPAIAVTFHRAAANGIGARPTVGAECAINEGPDCMVLTYADGERVEVWPDDVKPVETECMWHGAKQKLIDAAAISRDPSNGRAATVAVKRAAVAEVLERMRAGQWFKQRGEGTGTGGLLYRALCKFYEGRKSPEEVRAWLDTQDDAAQQSLRKNPRIAAIIETLRPAPKAGDSGFDADAALAAFGGED